MNRIVPIAAAALVAACAHQPPVFVSQTATPEQAAKDGAECRLEGTKAMYAAAAGGAFMQIQARDDTIEQCFEARGYVRQ
jgi:hypothetical protein